jgi:hypothetical protein
MSTDNKKFFVNTTKDYDMFNFLDTNRNANQTILKKLEKSILEHGVQIPIIVNQEKFIVDGQHRFWTLRKLNYHIPYIVSKAWKNDLSTIEINNTSTKWTAMDFANWASESGCLDVSEALRISKDMLVKTQKRLRPITCLEMFMEGRTHSGLRSKLRNLTYKIDRQRGEQIFESLMELDKHETQGSAFAARMVRTIKVMNYDIDDLNEEVIAIMCQDNYVRLYNNENDQLEYLQDIYNKALIKYNKLRK